VRGCERARERERESVCVCVCACACACVYVYVCCVGFGWEGRDRGRVSGRLSEKLGACVRVFMCVCTCVCVCVCLSCGCMHARKWGKWVGPQIDSTVVKTSALRPKAPRTRMEGW